MEGTTQVENGMALLDEAQPGWRELINLTTLDINTTHNCILGQVFGSYREGCRVLGIQAFSVKDSFGFTSAGGTENWQHLTEEWKLALSV